MINLIIFAAFATGIISYMVFITSNFIATVAILAISMIIIIALTTWGPFTTTFRGIFGVYVRRTAIDNNWRLWTLCALTAISFLLAIKYGPGHSVFLGAWEDSKSYLSEKMTPERQSKKNALLYGRIYSVDDNTIELARDYFAQFKNDYPLRKRRANESQETYDEHLRNWSRFGIFISSNQLANKTIVLNQSDYAIKWQQKKIQEAKNAQSERKTWIYWKIFWSFFVLTALYTPIAFADEVYEFIDSLMQKVKDAKDEINTEIQPEADQTTGTEAPAKPSTSQFNLMSWISTNLSFEVGLQLLQGLSRLIARRR